MNKSFTKNPLFIIIAVSVVVGLAALFEYRQPNSPNLTANISSGEVTQVKPVQGPVAEAVQSEPQSSTAQPQVQEEAPKVVSRPVVSKPKVTSSSNVIVSPSSVAAGESVTVTVSVPGSGDLSSIWQMDAYLESPTGLNTARGSIVSIDGEGRRFGSIAIPLGAELGTWTIKTVETFGNTGGITSYHYGTDIFTAFTVIAPQ